MGKYVRFSVGLNYFLIVTYTNTLTFEEKILSEEEFYLKFFLLESSLLRAPHTRFLHLTFLKKKYYLGKK